MDRSMGLDVVNGQESLQRNGILVSSLGRTLTEGDSGLRNFPSLLKHCITGKCWERRYVDALKKVVEFKRFKDFIEASRPEGLGSDLKTITNLCRDDPEALSLIDEATKNPIGTNQYTEKGVDNINTQGRPTGTSRQQAIRKLRKDRPDLLKDVESGKKSANAAMVEAGFRKVVTPQEKIRKIFLAMSIPERRKHLTWAKKNLRTQST